MTAPLGGRPLDFDALRKQADFIERPESRVGLADLGYTAHLLRWASDRLEYATYPATPVDCLISDLYAMFCGGELTGESFERRLADFKAEAKRA